MNPTAASDSADLRAWQAGDDSLLPRLIERWQRPLFAFACRYVQNPADAEDLVAETFVRLHQHRQRLRADSNLSAWLFTTLVNLCHKHYRWRRRHPTVRLDDPDDPAAVGAGRLADAPDPVEPSERDEALAALRAATDRLPHDLKCVVLLHHYERLSYREIGRITGCSERGVETRLYRARQQLRAALRPHLSPAAGEEDPAACAAPHPSA